MLILSRSKAFALSVMAVTVAIEARSFAGSDFMLDALPKFDKQVELQHGKTFYDFMQSELKDAMNGKRLNGDDGELLRQGKAVVYKLNENNYNMHVNYFDSPQSGRSYGWTRGQVGDWSDRTILKNMMEVAKGSDRELADFYRALVMMIGDCDSSGLSGLKGISERVATNFLAIYAAEEYRATLGTKNWDDALFETLMLGAFHAGQSKMRKFYMGTFQDFSFEQAPGVYNARGKAPKAGSTKRRGADLTDYWQYTAIPNKRVSGINETRPDFEKMGEAITSYERDNADLRAIESVVKGSGKNVIKDLTQYFAQGKASPSASEQLASHLADFLVQVRKDADKITDSVK